MANAKEKIRRMMGSFVGTSVSVATIAVVSSIQISLQATFLDLKVFQNAAFYQIEIIDTIIQEEPTSIEEEPMISEPLPTRLWVENQWGNFEIALAYGFNEGEISSLRENENYTLSIQYQGNLGWTTLATETIKTAPRLIGNVNQFSFNGSYVDDTIDIHMDVLTQAGFRPVDAFEIVLSQGLAQWREFVFAGLSSLTFSDLPHLNVPYEVSILAYIQNQAQEIFKQSYAFLPFVEGSYTRYFSAPGTIVVAPTRVSSTLDNEKYVFEIHLDNTIFAQTWDGESSELIFDNIPASVTLTLKWLVNYEFNNELNTILLKEETLLSIQRPTIVISKIMNLNSTTIQLTIDRANDFSALTFYQDNLNLPFSFVEENNFARYYVLTYAGVIEGVWELRGLLEDANPILYTLLVVQL